MSDFRMEKITAKQSADEIRMQLWRDDKYPIDPVTIASKLGIKVKEAVLDDEISGAIIKEPNKDAVIILNANDSDNRKRFTCAHELGHYIHYQTEGDYNDSFEAVDFRNVDSSLGTDAIEVFSNQFAANLLMPENEVKRLKKKGVNPVVLAVKFGVSLEAIEHRLNSLQ